VAILCAGTPTITVRDNRGLDVRSLRYNRTADGDVATQYVDAQTHSALGQPTSSQDPRFFGTETLNFQYTPALSGQVLRTMSVDAGTATACTDIAGQSIWQYSQGRDTELQSDKKITVLLSYDALGRPLQRACYTADISGGGSIGGATDILSYGDYRGAPSTTYDSNDTADPRNANQRGQILQHFDTAGLVDMSVQGYAVQGTTLREERRFLATACDATTHWQAGTPQTLYGLNKGWLEPDTNPANLYSTGWTYDALAQVLTQVDAKGHQRHTSYDGAGRKYTASVTPNGGTLTPVCTGITYTAAGEIDTRNDANNIQIVYAYEPQTTQRLVSITALRGSKKLQALAYACDGVGNVIALSDSSAGAQVSFFRNRAVTPDRGYTYDALYQLTSATGRENYVNNTPKGTDWPGAQFSPTNTPNYQAYARSYTYDLGGNLTAIRSANWGDAKPPTRQLVVGNSSNRAVCTANNPGATQANIDTYFDPAGKSIYLDANRNQPMYWTALHQLYCVVTTYRSAGSGAGSGEWSDSDREQYAYDGSGHRVRKYASSLAGGGADANSWNIADTRYLAGLELRTNTATGEHLEVIVLDDGARMLNWAGGAGKPDDIPNLQLRYQYSDRQNSCQLETDNDGNVITQEEYYPYGGTAVLASRTDSEVKYKYVRYSGKERDATGLYYYGLRYYQPWIGRWINPDPAGPTATQNLYCMVSNNPVTKIDAYGAVEEEPQATRGCFGNLFGCFQRNPAMHQPLAPSAAETSTRTQADQAATDTVRTSSRASSRDGYTELIPHQAGESDEAIPQSIDSMPVPQDPSRTSAPLDGWWVEDQKIEENLSSKIASIGIDWVPKYASWLQDPRGPRAAASDSKTILDIHEQYGENAAELWKFAVRYVGKLHDSQGVETEQQRFARLCQLGEIKTVEWDNAIKKFNDQHSKPRKLTNALNDTPQQADFEKWMIDQEKETRPSSSLAEPDEPASAASARDDDEAAWARHAYVSKELRHGSYYLVDSAQKTQGFKFDTVDPQRPGHRFSLDVSRSKIRLMEAFRSQKTKEYYANDVSVVQLCAAKDKTIALDGIQLLELNDIVNQTTLDMLSAHNDTRKPASHIGPNIWYDRWGDEDPRFVHFFSNSVHGKRVTRLLDDMGKAPTALWRYDAADDKGVEQNDLFVFMKQSQKTRHPALR